MHAAVEHVAHCIESHSRQLPGSARLLCSAPGVQAMACLWAAVWRSKALCQRWQSQLAVATQAR